MLVRIDVAEARAEIVGGDHRITFASDGLFSPSVDASFALWAMLPLAMRAGENMHVAAPVDPVALANANILSRIWAMWMPEIYSAIDVTADAAADCRAGERPGPIQLYSGGVDSTHAILTTRPPFALTVHGLEYGLDNDDGFASLVEKTDPLLREYGCRRLVIRTNMRKVLGKPAVTHGFMLAACLFLLRHRFSHSTIAADYNWAQDMVTFPWGTNHVTNRYFAGGDFDLRSLDGDKTRLQKVARISEDALACNALTFCTDHSVRPRNCGVCNKCVRTKAMFLAATGSMPPIFLKPGLDSTRILVANLHEAKEFAFFTDLYQTAKDNGRLSIIPGLQEHMENNLRQRRSRRRMARIWSKISKPLR